MKKIDLTEETENEFIVEIHGEGENTIVSFQGSIDESASFKELKIPDNALLILDLTNITRLNSCGLLLWVRWIRSLGKDCSVSVIRNCPKIFVDQLSIIDGLVPSNAIIQSIHVPYHCSHCHANITMLAERGTDYTEGSSDRKAKHSIPEEIECASCGKDMEIEALIKKYLNFLEIRKR